MAFTPLYCPPILITMLTEPRREMSNMSKWFAVGAVILMLLSMFAYVASDDESLQPGPPPAAETGANS